jgi:hypothetical protein
MLHELQNYESLMTFRSIGWNDFPGGLFFDVEATDVSHPAQ